MAVVSILEDADYLVHGGALIHDNEVVLQPVHGVVLQGLALDSVGEYVDRDELVGAIVTFTVQLICVQPLDESFQNNRLFLLELHLSFDALNKRTVESAVEEV